MCELLTEAVSYGFMQRALIVGVLMSLCAGVLGVHLVLKRFSMIGDGLSHVGFAALALASVLHFSPLAVSLPLVIAAAFFILWAQGHSEIQGDAMVGVLSIGALAFGMILIALTTGVNADVNSYLFGSILSMNKTDVALSVTLCAGVFILYILFYQRVFAVTFDETFAQATGTPTGYYQAVLSLMTAVTIVVGMRVVGALLISGLIIFPALSAMRLCRRYRSVVIVAAVLSPVCCVIGLLLSFFCSAPAGAGIILVQLAAYLLTVFISILRGRSA
ncbi:MAG: metal ABC transporter permease [Lachnospiraceae bacterium]